MCLKGNLYRCLEAMHLVTKTQFLLSFLKVLQDLCYVLVVMIIQVNENVLLVYLTTLLEKQETVVTYPISIPTSMWLFS